LLKAPYMATKIEDIEVFRGKTTPYILLIAPHGYPDDDENTGQLARFLHEILDCPAIENEVYRKPAKISEDPELWEVPSMDDRILNFKIVGQIYV